MLIGACTYVRLVMRRDGMCIDGMVFDPPSCSTSPCLPHVELPENWGSLRREADGRASHHPIVGVGGVPEPLYRAGTVPCP